MDMAESNSIHGAQNTITLGMTFTASVPVGATVYVASIPPNQSPSDTLRLTGDGARYFSYNSESQVGGTALWYDAGGCRVSRVASAAARPPCMGLANMRHIVFICNTVQPSLCA